MDIPKDVNYEIFLRLSDGELVKFCQVNKKAKEYCNDEVFWMNRILYKFPYIPIKILEKYKGERSWSNYYIQDLRKIKVDAPIRLMVAASNGRLDHVMILTNEGMYVPEAMSNAISSGNLDLIKYLASEGYLIDPRDLVVAAQNGHLNIVKFFVENGVDVNIRGHFGETALQAAKGHIDVIDYLIKKGAKN